MRAIYILYILLIIIINGCATVEVAKEVTKVTNKVRTTIQKITSDQDDVEKTENHIKEDDVEYIEATENFIKEKKEIVVERKKQDIVIRKQKEIIVVNIQGKTLNQLSIETVKGFLIDSKKSNFKI